VSRYDTIGWPMGRYAHIGDYLRPGGELSRHAGAELCSYSHKRQELQLQLKDLRPSRGVDLAELSGAGDQLSWKTCLPSALSEPMLLGLARDFRCVEEAPLGSHKRKQDEVMGLAHALAVITSVLMTHPARGARTDSLDIPIQGLMEAMQIYQFGIEREVVTRIIGIPAPDTEHTVRKALERYLHY
jgi:hypothetical protein